MLSAFPLVRTLYYTAGPPEVGDLVGADSWLNLIAKRANWAYGVAHGPNRFFRQAHSENTVQYAWQGEVAYRAEHPTLNFSAEIKGAGDYTLEYYGADTTWHAAAAATAGGAGWTWFGGSQSLTYATGAWSLPDDGMLRLRLVSADEVYVYRAYMSGTGGLTAWPTFPTFADAGTPTAAQVNTLRTGGEYLYERACHNLTGTAGGTVSHSNPSWAPFLRLAFRYSGTEQLRVTTSAEEMEVDGHNYVYIEAEDYNPDSDGRRGGGVILVDISTDETETTRTVDLSAQSLTVGNRYIVEIGQDNTAGSGGYLTVHDVALEDLAGVTRANVPHVWAEGDVILAADLNALAADMTEMRDDAASDSPIWPEHYLASYQPGAEARGVTGPFFWLKWQRFTHRWRFLRYRGSGRICSIANAVPPREASITGEAAPEYQRNITDTGEDEGLIDLDSLGWLAYGMDYYVQDTAGHLVLCAQEDYRA
jgi:hypothetical protein